MLNDRTGTLNGPTFYESKGNANSEKFGLDCTNYGHGYSEGDCHEIKIDTCTFSKYNNYALAKITK
jgi:hypothetical protein